MATFTFGIDDPNLGKLTVPYEVPTSDMPRVFMALAAIYGVELNPRELLRSLSDEIITRQLTIIQRTLADIAAKEAAAAVLPVQAAAGDVIEG